MFGILSGIVMGGAGAGYICESSRSRGFLYVSRFDGRECWKRTGILDKSLGILYRRERPNTHFSDGLLGFAARVAPTASSRCPLSPFRSRPSTPHASVYDRAPIAEMLTSHAVGGIVYHYLGPLAPFETTFILLVSCTIFGSLFLPYIQPDQNAKAKSQTFLQPLKTFIPRRRREGENGRNWNLALLGAGAFFSVLATGYVPMALQLVGINAFGFGPEESGIMQVSRVGLTRLRRARRICGREAGGWGI
jgi:hypothetical protein